MEIAKILVSGTHASIIERRCVPAGLVGGTITVEYAAGAWDGLTKTVVFKSGETKDVITNENVVVIPWETVSTPNRRLQVGFYGMNSDKKLIVPTCWADLGLIQPAADPSGDVSADPSLPVYAQLAEEIEKLKEHTPSSPDSPGQDGEDGGYYTPSLTQPDDNTLEFQFTPSKPDMPAVDPVQVTLPVSGGNVDVTIDGETLVIEENSTATIENETLIL